MLKYSLIVPLALVLLLSSNAETLVNKTKDVLSQKEAVSEELSGSAKTDIVSPMNELIINEVKDAHTAIDTLPQNSKQVIEKSDNDRIYTVVEKMPQFPGGEKELLKYIGQNLKYPVIAQENRIQGMVIIRFVVNSTGKVVNAMVIKSIMNNVNMIDEVVAVGYGVKKATNENVTEPIQTQPGTDMKPLEKEAIRLVNSIPDFTPGEMNGKKVAVYYTLPINFKMI